MDLYPNTVAHDEARAALDMTPDCLVFAFIGGLRPNKGVENLIAAFKHLEGDDVRLVIAGHPGESKQYIESLREAAREDERICMHEHFVPDSQLQVYLNASDVVVLPFDRILTSGSAIMAMGFARPVIVPAMGCLPELITDGTGVLYDPASPSGLLHALRRCRELQSELPAMGRRAQSRVAQFTADEMAEKTLLAYGVQR
jgi:glycosyltransferase involved in cell wall biosynthesis